MTIFYKLENKLYINITNACPCACVFCIRNQTDSVGDAKSLWLTHEPTTYEIKQSFDMQQDLDHIDEIVFCGYGEPMMRANDIIDITSYIKTKTNLPIRMNTNGLIKLIDPSFEISKLKIIDSISVSLNADDAEEYYRLVNPSFGLSSFNALIDFIKEASNFTAITLTVLEDLAPHRIENCRKLAHKLGLPLRVRTYM